jgi:hypothetical protein
LIHDVKLDWPDLIVERFGEDGGLAWLAPWWDIVVSRVAVIFMNKFGCWFLQRPSGEVQLLNVFTGTLETIASSHQEFSSRVNTKGWQEANLLVQLVAALHHEGKIPAPNQCYAVALHTAIGGPNPMSGEIINVNHVMVMETEIWQSICVQALRRRKGTADA